MSSIGSYLFPLFKVSDVLAKQAEEGIYQVRRARISDLAQIQTFWASKSELPFTADLLPLLWAANAQSLLLLWQDGEVCGVAALNVDAPATLSAFVVDEAVSSEGYSLFLLISLTRMKAQNYLYALASSLDETRLTADVLACGLALQHKPQFMLQIAQTVETEATDILYTLDPQWLSKGLSDLKVGEREIVIRFPYASEKLLVVDWVATTFGRGWASEVSHAFREQITCLIAVDKRNSLKPSERLLGFLTFNTAALGVISALGIPDALQDEWLRNQLSLHLLYGVAQRLYEQGYIFAVGDGIRLELADVITTLLGDYAWKIPGSYPGVFEEVISYR